jgi:hypothetical protein
MSWDLMYDVEDFKLASKGWHIVRVKSVEIKATDRAKNPDTANDKNFVVKFVVTEGSSDDGCEITKYFAHISQNDFTLRQLGAMMVCAGVITPNKLTGPDVFEQKGFETTFNMKLPEKLLGVFVDHRAGDRKRDDGSTVYFPDIKKYRTIKDAQAEIKENGGKANVESTANPQSASANPPNQPAQTPAAQAQSDAWD